MAAQADQYNFLKSCLVLTKRQFARVDMKKCPQNIWQEIILKTYSSSREHWAGLSSSAIAEVEYFWVKLTTCR